MDAAGELAQLVQRAGRLGGQRRPAAPPARRTRGGTAACAARSAQGEGDQSLLGAVVQVALDAPAGWSAAATIRAREAVSSA